MTSSLPLFKFPPKALKIVIGQLDLMVRFDLATLSERAKTMVKENIEDEEPTAINVHFPYEIEVDGFVEFVSREIKWQFWKTNSPESINLINMHERTLNGFKLNMTSYSEEWRLLKYLNTVRDPPHKMLDCFDSPSLERLRRFGERAARLAPAQGRIPEFDANMAIILADREYRFMSHFEGILNIVVNELDRPITAVLTFLLDHLNCRIDKFDVHLVDVDDPHTLFSRKFPCDKLWLVGGELNTAADVALMWDWASTVRRLDIQSRMGDVMLDRPIAVTQFTTAGSWINVDALKMMTGCHNVIIESAVSGVEKMDDGLYPEWAVTRLTWQDLNAFMHHVLRLPKPALQQITYRYDAENFPMDWSQLTDGFGTVELHKIVSDNSENVFVKLVNIEKFNSGESLRLSDGSMPAIMHYIGSTVHIMFGSLPASVDRPLPRQFQRR